jgi:DNA-binding CsgD family transcriptional regulator
MGDLGKAELLLQELYDGAQTFEHFQSGMEAELWAASGDLDAAADALVEMRDSVDLTAEPGAWEWFWPLVDLHLARGETDAAVTLADELLRAGTGDSDFEVATMARVSTAALATATLSGRPVPPSLHGGSAELLARADLIAETGGCRWGTVAGAEHATARAWSARVAGNPAVHPWRQAHDAWLATGFAYRALQVHAELAWALLRFGDRTAALDAVTEVAQRSRDMGARAIARRVETWARERRLVLPGTPSCAPGPLDRLTPREREVLGLVASGASNRAIAKALFISEKTASVHVSNLMAKLVVGSRLEAAALAHQLQLSEQSGPAPKASGRRE